MNINIKRRGDGKIIFSGEFESIKKCVEAAVAQKVSLSYADLSYADLRYADLSYAVLSYAVLRSADLRSADLRYAKLDDIRADFLAEVLRLPNELEFLLNAIVTGKINGSTYNDGECGCLAGTMAIAKGLTGYNGGPIKNGLTFHANGSSPRERFFLAIKKGDTPETNSASKVVLGWTDEAIAIRDNIRNTAPNVAAKPAKKAPAAKK